MDAALFMRDIIPLLQDVMLFSAVRNYLFLLGRGTVSPIEEDRATFLACNRSEPSLVSAINAKTRFQERKIPRGGKVRLPLPSLQINNAGHACGQQMALHIFAGGEEAWRKIKYLFRTTRALIVHY